jgi:hypothetical protein
MGKVKRKPKPKKHKAILDYRECANYIAYKLGIKDLRDVDGKFDPKNAKRMDEIEYKDFWHFVCDNGDVHNGCEIYLPLTEDDNPQEEWIRKIVHAFNKEFGEEVPYWVEW